MISYTSFAFFILYFGITYFLYCLFPQKAKWCVLLFGSYVFYFISSKGHILPLIFSTLTVWALAYSIQKLNDDFKAKRRELPKEERKVLRQKYKRKKSLMLFAAVILSLGLLLICKYSNFFIQTANFIFKTHIAGVDIVQPLGISFFTLQAISYIYDVYSGKYEAQKNPFRVALYLSFMLTIVEGPFARYDNLGVQLQKCKKFSTCDLVFGAQRVVWGLFKKIVVADRAAEFVNAVFDNSGKFSGVVVLFAVLFYTLQLYCEFSGVMDVMCGLGEMMGLKLPENFRQPFFAETIKEFWHRWHITLGTWLRDYIFYPISLSKPFMKLSKSAVKKLNKYYAILIPVSAAMFFVWFANGFWHGAGWKYIVYGLYYYALMMLGLFIEPLFEKICFLIKINRKSKPFKLFRIARTFAIVNIGMLIFRADSLNQALSMFKSVFTNPNLSAILPGSKNGLGLDIMDYVIIALGTLIVFAFGLIKEKGIDIREKISKLPYILKFIIFMIAIFAVIVFGAYGEGYGAVDLIYANF